MGQRALSSRYPHPGWVEQDPEEIWFSQWAAVQDCLAGVAVAVDDIAAIGLANQRETTIMWDRASGRPVYPAIVWQCRRTAFACDQMRVQGLESMIRDKTGLTLDAYFSATKIAWILDHVPGLRRRAEAGEVAFGTVDSWLVYKLTGGHSHLTDVSNASRTLLYNIRTLAWDEDLLSLFGVPPAVLPTVVESSGVATYTQPQWLGRRIPIAGIAGDQQAALFGHGANQIGMTKNTYGTGSFLLMNVGMTPVPSAHGLLTTIAWAISGEPVCYALEGSVFAAGSVIEWLTDSIHLLGNAADSEALAQSVVDTEDVYVVPAFTGLGAPYWDPNARGIIVGITRGTTRAHLVRAALESIAYQTRDIVVAMTEDSQIRPSALYADGKPITNGMLAQFQADILGIPVIRSPMTETTALGAALLAGLGISLWNRREAPVAHVEFLGHEYLPKMAASERQQRYQRWMQAVERSKGWAHD